MKQLSARALWTMVPAALLATATMAQSTAINTTGAVAAASSLLDISSTNRGLLIPRMTQAQRTAIVAPSDGLWVYQIPNAGNTLPNGFWYYDASAPDAGWYRMSSGSGWLLAGNSGTNPVTNYLGTTDNVPLVIATNDVERMRLFHNTAPTPASFLGINNPAPVEALSVTGGIHLGTGAAPGSLTTTPGVIRYNPAPTLPAPFPAMNPVIPYHEGGASYTYGVLPAVNTMERLENAFLEVNDGNYPGSVLQCGSGSAETPNNGGISNAGGPNFNDTPFPTSVGRGSKFQYIFTAVELTAMGLCPGFITELAFRPVQDDNNFPGPPVSSASIGLEIRMRNVVGPVNLAAGYDLTLSQSASLNGVGGQTILVASGLLPVPLTTPFNWTGGDLMIDLSYTRAPQVGISPAVQVNTGFANCSRWGWFGTPVPGNTIHTSAAAGFTVVPAAQTGSHGERPVTRFTGQAQVPVPTVLQGDYVQYSGGLLVGSAAWASTPGVFQGPGVVRAEVACYDGNVQLSDHIFDRYFDGAAKTGEGHLAGSLTPLDELEGYLAAERHLPSMPSRHQWESRGPSSLGELSTGLWEAVEEQALYIIELNNGLKDLETAAFGEKLSTTELADRIAMVQDSPRLTSEEKARIIAGLRGAQRNQHN
ncbi:MAG: hypothetical protein IPJ76_03780 [Flavobacteriales bacterium]|nr:MAG: hypothetical protein IPJ76_03780 [Flavobacteriales bacterium]